MQNMENNLDKNNKIYSYMATIVIIVTIVHLIGEVIVQSLTQYNEETGLVTGYSALGMLYNIAGFSMIFASNQKSTNALKAVPAIISIGLAFIFIFTAIKANKSKHKNILFCTIFYSIDTLFIIPNAIISNLGNYLVTYNTISIIVSCILHIVFIAPLIYGSFLEFKIKGKGV